MPRWGLTGGYQSGILLGVEAVSTGTVQGLPLLLYSAKLQFGSLHFPSVMYFVSKYHCIYNLHSLPLLLVKTPVNGKVGLGPILMKFSLAIDLTNDGWLPFLQKTRLYLGFYETFTEAGLS